MVLDSIVNNPDLKVSRQVIQTGVVTRELPSDFQKKKCFIGGAVEVSKYYNIMYLHYSNNTV